MGQFARTAAAPQQATSQPAAPQPSPLLGPVLSQLASPALAPPQPDRAPMGIVEPSTPGQRVKAPMTHRLGEAPPRTTFDFSRIPVHTQGSGPVQARSKTSGSPNPGGAYSRTENLGSEPPRRLSGNGRPSLEDRTGIPAPLRAGLEALSGLDLSGIRVHYGSSKPARVQALAYTEGHEIHIGPGHEKVLPHEGWHAVQQIQGRVKPTFQAAGLAINDETHLEQEASRMGEKAWRGTPNPPPGGDRSPVGSTALQQACFPARPVIQRAMKFEIQTTNHIFRNRGGTATLLGRKYGPTDFLVKGKTGVRLESESHGVLEFETDWFRKWSGLQSQLQEAVEMTDAMNGADAVSDGRKKFPFDVSHLRTGTAEEVKAGAWKYRKGFEGSGEKILQKKEQLETKIADDTWNSGIQSSESFELEQYETFLKQHEWTDLADPVIKSAQDILDAANTGKLPASDLSRLRSFLQIVVNYIQRGQGKPGGGGKKEYWKGAFANVEGMPSKQAFVLMSRTSFSSMYKSLLTKPEQKLFIDLVNDQKNGILPKLGLDQKSPFFVKGYGTGSHQSGPTVYQWLVGISGGKDLLTNAYGKGLSASMGKFDVAQEKGKQKGLVRFETRNTVGGAWAKAVDWVSYAKKLFEKAATDRKRPSGKGETGLKL